ncbi:hypothetical protein DOU02_06690 [Clavibacter michiganensis subsp. michiganensis]|uniref:hypothetical protein n=1 Tax=Clavibacter michiganensis TaxID=28447 RepID=UPI001303AD3F|nr:hypothetical protein [Clavibacter michiganensis]KAF0258765.1 hypothetical protein DOU02_06690 [Clavibacter michiganensis subsp. michiganensis]
MNEIDTTKSSETTEKDGVSTTSAVLLGPGFFSSVPTSFIGPRSLRDSGVRPLFASETSGAERYRHEFRDGLALLGEDTLDRVNPKRNRPVRPQQGWIFDVCSAVDDDGLALHETTAICLPRRAAKSSSIWAMTLGRCLNRPGYRVAVTAQSGTAMRARWISEILKRIADAEHPLSAQIQINRSNGAEKMIFPNGATFELLPPVEKAFRGASYDLVIVDEAQEVDEDIDAGIRPTLDTNPGAQIILIGTAGESRSGYLYHFLELGRRGESGIIEYAVPEDVTEEDLLEDGEKSWDKVRPYVLAAHPGVSSGLTPEKVAKARFDGMPFSSFMREYLGMWPRGAGDSIIDPEHWAAGKTDEGMPERPPANAVLGIAIGPNDSSAAIVAVWRDTEGKACLMQVNHRAGISWLTKRTVELSRKYKLPVAHDTAAGTITTEVEALKRVQTPKPRLLPQKFVDLKRSHAQLQVDISRGLVKHWGQDELTASVLGATKRTFGDRGGWLFARKNVNVDIVPLEAAALALLAFDSKKPRSRVRAIDA